MKIPSFLYLLALAAVTLHSCYREIDLKKYRTAPKLVINSVAEAGVPITASISRTWFYTDNTPDVTITNAEVSLYLDGIFCETLTQKQPGSYLSSVIPQAGDRVKIVAVSPEYGTVWAEDIIPEPVRIDDIKITLMKKENNGSSRIEFDENGNPVIIPVIEEVYRYQITFQDTPNRKDYYALTITGQDRIGTDTLEVYASLDFSSDPVFRQQGSILSQVIGYGNDRSWKGNLFTDQLIDGQKYTLTIKEYCSESSIVSDERYISLYRLSAAYYQYLRSLYILSEENDITYGLSEIGIAEPLQNFSNVAGGTGILGASQRADTTIYIGKES